MDFAGQVAIITGAGDGLGRSYAKWMAARGAAIVVNNRRRLGAESTAQQVASEIVADGGKAVAIDFAVDEPASGKALLNAALDAFGRIDILICNAGTQVLTPFAEVDLDEFRKIIDINLWGTLYPLRAVWPLLLEQGYGRVVLTSSTNGTYGFANATSYSASKASMIGLTRSLAKEVPDGVDLRINAIAPGAVTKIAKGLVPESLTEIMHPDKVAPPVGWLASRECRENGSIFKSAAGRISRMRVVESVAVDLPLDNSSFDWERLNAMDQLTEAKTVFEAIAKFLPEGAMN